MSKRSRLVSDSPAATIAITIGTDQYLLNEVKAIVGGLDGEERYIPATKVDSIADLNRFEGDDVWSREFLGALIIPEGQVVSPDIDTAILCHLSEGITIPDGPYILHSSTGRIYSILKLCEDFNDAFVGGTLPDGPLRYMWLTGFTKIPVAPRSYSGTPTADLPLAGMRFGLKDAIDVAGLETGNGSKCYREFYPPRDLTAAFVAKLVNAGAVMVGKTRLCQWCDGQDPLERLEEVTPTNPRGDAFQKPSASSSGSAAGCASYSWLDFTIGTDTGGSVRHPAAVNGLYGIRPTLGSVSSSGLICTNLMDTVGLFTRSAKVAEIVTKVMQEEITTKSIETQGKKRFKLLYAVDPPSAEHTETPKFFSSKGQGPEISTPAGQLLENFVRRLEEHIGLRRQEVCIYDLWRETHPPNISDDLVHFKDPIYKNIVYGQLSRDVVQPFVRDYQNLHGRPPFIESRTKARLDHGASISDAELQKSITAFESFAAWVNEKLLPAPSDPSDEIPLFIYPQSWGKPNYRDHLAQSKQVFWSGFSVYSVSYCSGCPDYTLPVGEVEFESKVTERTEYLPVAISIMAPRNMDGILLELIRDLENKNVLKAVGCGSRLYDS